MFKKFVVLTLGVVMALFASQNAFAQKTMAENNITVFSPELVTPLKFSANTGDKLDLNIVNRSREDIIFEIPIMQISVEVPKSLNKVVPVDLSQPVEKDIQFVIRQRGSNMKEGKIVVEDYTVKRYTSDVNRLDTTFLSEIINYQNQPSEWQTKYESTVYEKDEDQGEDHRMQQSEKRYIRGNF